MLWSLVMAKGEELLKAEPILMKAIVSMCSDNNWRIRRDAAQYLSQFLQELHVHKKSPKKSGGIEEVKSRKGQSPGGVIPTFGGGSESPSPIKLKREVQIVEEFPAIIKLSKQKFREDFYELMAELTAD